MREAFLWHKLHDDIEKHYYSLNVHFKNRNAKKMAELFSDDDYIEYEGERWEGSSKIEKGWGIIMQKQPGKKFTFETVEIKTEAIQNDPVHDYRAIITFKFFASPCGMGQITRRHTAVQCDW
jgi:hypothetical protein